MSLGAGGKATTSVARIGADATPRAVKPAAPIPSNIPAEYWRQHAALESKYHGDVEKVHNAYKNMWIT
uniref:Uncharacterized protein n=1 Tax=Peronospora matthiolae TaxID=2874970 RepID=A0AAV1U3G4_9STRA